MKIFSRIVLLLALSVAASGQTKFVGVFVGSNVTYRHSAPRPAFDVTAMAMWSFKPQTTLQVQGIYQPFNQTFILRVGGDLKLKRSWFRW